VHIADISRAFLAVLQAPRELIHNKAFNVGRNEDNYRIRDLADIVRETVPGCVIEYAKDASPDKRNYRVDCSHIANVLQEFRPAWDARKGAQELFAAYRQVGLRLEDFEGSRFKRIDQIKQLLASGKLAADLRWSDQAAAVEKG
jgi:nucleoside-diphosphate-sugar epimerase